jgi:hypothetical protein
METPCPRCCLAEFLPFVMPRAILLLKKRAQNEAVRNVIMTMGLKERFLNVYANIPLGARKEIILTIENEAPITWDVAFIEVKNDTEFSKVILDKLELLGLI